VSCKVLHTKRKNLVEYILDKLSVTNIQEFLYKSTIREKNALSTKRVFISHFEEMKGPHIRRQRTAWAHGFPSKLGYEYVCLVISHTTLDCKPYVSAAGLRSPIRNSEHCPNSGKLWGKNIHSPSERRDIFSIYL
jgi:hypothetical protein